VKLLAAVAVLAAFTLSAHAATRQTARVTVTDVAPFTVHGSRFLSHERVTVVVTIKDRHVHVVTSSSAGTFTTRFTSVSLGHCTGYAVQARGNRGSAAFLKVMPECAPLQPVEPAALMPTDPTPKQR